MAGLQIRAVEVGASTPQASLLARPWTAHLTNRPTENFGETLQGLCAQLAGPFAEMSGITLTCTAEQQRIPEPWQLSSGRSRPAAPAWWAPSAGPMPVPTASSILHLLAVTYLQTGVSMNCSPGDRLHVAATEPELTIEHSGPGTWAARDKAAATREERLVTRLGGKLASPWMIGGVHIVVTLPRR